MEMYSLCHQYMNRCVRITTYDGQSFEGVIVNVDADHVYIQPLDGAVISSKNNTSNKAQISGWGFGFGRGFGFGARNSILALSLFTLLAIALI